MRRAPCTTHALNVMEGIVAMWAQVPVSLLAQETTRPQARW
jgi:hypothetical protein